MATTRNVIKAFLASPGDLREERLAVKAAVEEFNATWADELGYQVQLVGWEDTVSVIGRPQSAINRDLEKCDAFIGLMWKRWGSPPDSDSKYTSGFEEEFWQSIARRHASGRPEMSMFFKNIPSDLLQDPGDDLKKVIAFREHLIAERTLLFQHFDTSADLQELVRRKISSLVQSLLQADRSRASSSSAPTDDAPESFNGADVEAVVSENEEAHFLDAVSQRITSGAAVSLDAARLRLIAQGISDASNDRTALGPHDANIIFAQRKGLELGYREVSDLASAGLERLDQQNAPLWHWLYQRTSPAEFLVIESLVGATDAVKVGAIRALGLTSMPINSFEPIERGRLIESWLKAENDSKIKSAALIYLSEHGSRDDIHQVKSEYEKSDAHTARKAYEALIRIYIRLDVIEAVQFIIDVPNDISSEVVTQKVISSLGFAKDNQILLLLDSQVSLIRESALKEAISRDIDTVDIITRLIEDRSARIRNLALDRLEQRQGALSPERVKSILFRPVKSAFSATASDHEGEANWEAYRTRQYRALSIDELLLALRDDGPFRDAAYVALLQRHDHKKPFDPRDDLRDLFVGRFEEIMAEYQEEHGEDFSNRVRQLSEHLRKRFYRAAFTETCLAARKSDLGIIREALDSAFVDPLSPEIDFLAKHGDWSDIERLSAAGDRWAGASIWSSAEKLQFRTKVANTINKISGTKASQVLDLEISATMLEHVVRSLPLSRLADVSDDQWMKLFMEPEDSLRRVAAISFCAVGTKANARALLDRYVGQNGTRYYNVVFWLDLAASAPSVAERKRTAKAALIAFA